LQRTAKAEFERDLIRERTGAGREAAKKRGVRFGRPRKLALDQGELARRLVSEGKSIREIASVFNVHPATIYRLAAIQRLEWLPKTLTEL
jgi:DNA invertase Pin-like site-specific DNA recombinase